MCRVIFSSVFAFGFLLMSLYFHSLKEYESEHQCYLVGALFGWFACWTIIRYFKQNKRKVQND